MAQGQAKLDVVDFQEAVSEIETVLQNTHDKEQSARLQRALSILKNNAVTLQIGGQEVTIIANSKLTVSQENDSRITYDSQVANTNNKVNEQVAQHLDGTMTETEQYVDTKTVADYFGVSTETVRNWIKQKKIIGAQIGGSRGKFMIPKAEFDFLKDKRESSQADTVMKELLGSDYKEDEWEVLLDGE